MYQKPDLTEKEVVALLGCIHLALRRIMKTEDESFEEVFKRQSMDDMQTAQVKLRTALKLPSLQNMLVTVDPNTGDIQTVVYDTTRET